MNEMMNLFFRSLAEATGDGEQTEAAAGKMPGPCVDDLLTQLAECRSNECKLRRQINEQAIREGKSPGALSLNPGFDTRKAEKMSVAQFLAETEAWARNELTKKSG